MFTEIILQLPMDDINRFQRKVAAAYTGLIRNYKKFIPHILKKVQGLHGIGIIFDVIDVREIILIYDQSPVAIEENSFPCFNLLSPR